MNIEQSVFPFDPRANIIKPNWLKNESYHDFSIRLRAYYISHPDECPHSMIGFAPHDGLGTEWYERCSDCLTRITPEIRDTLYDY